ncbi:taste receptor type 1 member 2 isoform X1 [Alligator sinensis]|uniref:Taste receptor type 1 member 2 n=2 Tax=Alligator sinensis TaxID=38654 RepID=A0A3Q0HBD8_ALLSI|nr:taste receptor type 1 member 2 isoform X1 [Alligator sinensis]XP_025068918.1 taste receptor type 1 member 2 isoform X1 [Alligator sinensis]
MHVNKSAQTDENKPQVGGSKAGTCCSHSPTDWCSGSSAMREARLCFSALLIATSLQTLTASDFHLPGDYVLGGLFSLHAETVGKSYFAHAEVPRCQTFNLKIVGYSFLRAMRFAVEEINNSSTLLPGISLGYEMVDVCYHTNIVHPLLYFLADNHSKVQLQQSYARYRPRVLAVVGPDSSPGAVTVANVLSSFLIPQITYTATTESLRNPKRFPVAFRTIHSTEQMIKAMLLLLKHFHWNWVIVLFGDDDYGQENLKLLQFWATGVCIAFQESIPVPRESKKLSLEQQAKVQDIINMLHQSTAKVVLVLTLDLTLPFFFQEAIRQNITDLVWIGTEAWATDPSLHSITNISRLGTFLGVAVREVPIPGFNTFRVKAPSNQTEGAGTWASDPGTCNQVCDRCLSAAKQKEKELRDSGERIDFNVYSAVYVIAHALHRLLRCSSAGCHKRAVYPWQLLPEVRQVDFSLLDNKIQFDENGDPPNSFVIVQWRWDQDNHLFKKIAYYSTKHQKLLFGTDNISWHTPGNEVPVSICSYQCIPGQRKKPIGLHPCCFECVDCEAGTYFNESDHYNCQPCPATHWSNVRSQACYPKVVTYLAWDDHRAVVLLIVSLLGLLTTLATLLTFAFHLRTPVVKSAGGGMCLLMLASLVICFLIILAYVGIPTAFKCVWRHTVYSFCFTLCISCIVIRSLQIVCIFKLMAKLPKAYNYWTKYKGPYIFMAVVLALKAVTLMINFIISSPAPVELPLEDNPAILVLDCKKTHAFLEMLDTALDMSLSVLCFCFAYVGKEFPKNYNEAKYIALWTTSYFTTWVILFVAITAYPGVLVPFFNALFNVVNLLGIVIGYFGPKCYIIFFHPERNTSAYFQTDIQTYTMRQK